jgi:hypothetical protein
MGRDGLALGWMDRHGQGEEEESRGAEDQGCWRVGGRCLSVCRSLARPILFSHCRREKKSSSTCRLARNRRDGLDGLIPGYLREQCRASPVSVSPGNTQARVAWCLGRTGGQRGRTDLRTGNAGFKFMRRLQPVRPAAARPSSPVRSFPKVSFLLATSAQSEVSSAR